MTVTFHSGRQSYLCGTLEAVYAWLSVRLTNDREVPEGSDTVGGNL